MKKSLLIFPFLLVSLMSFAQIQQGIVKTRGRMVDGEVVPGTRLAGATITLNFGNPLVSNDQGTFSFNVPAAKSYSLVSAKKQGYTLADPEYTRRSFSYSADNPFYVVLEDENQRQADINAATRKVRRTLMAQLDEREEEIESLKAQNKLTEKEYQDRLKQLYDNQSKSEQLVRKMAERYASTDYDQLDEFNRQVQMYIEEGELQKADSLIRSKGDIEKRVADYHEVVAANNAEREKLEQSEKGAARTYEDLSRDLLNRSEIFLQRFQQDSALYCLKLRADLDTSSVVAVWDYANLCLHQNKISDCEKYILMCLNTSIQNDDTLAVALVTGFLGNLYLVKEDFLTSEKYLKSAVEISETIIKNNPEFGNSFLLYAQTALGDVYSKLHDFGSSEKYYLSVVEKCELFFKQNPDYYQDLLSDAQKSLGDLYSELHDYDSSVRYYKLSLKNREQLFQRNPDANRGNLAGLQNNLGVFYSKIRDYESGIKYYKMSLEYIEQLFQQNPDAYRIDYARLLNNLGTLYADIEDHTNAEKYLKLAYKYYELLYQQNPDAYRIGYASLLDNLGTLYADIEDYANAEKYFKLALENFEVLYMQTPDAYRANLAMVEGKFGEMFINIHSFSNGEKYLKSSRDTFEQLFKQDPDVYRFDLAWIQKTYGTFCGLVQDYVNSEKYYKLSLENYEQLFKSNPEVYRFDIAMLYGCLGNLYREISDFINARKYYDSALIYFEQLFKLNPDLFRDRYASTLFFLGSCYLNESYEEAAGWYRKAAEQGHVGAQFSLGTHYWRGEGVEQSYEEAVKWFFMAAENGDPDAQYLLGNCYYNGIGIVQSNDEAMKWYRKAAEQGNVYAQYMLGSLYYINKDYSNGEKYLKLALTYFEYAYKYNQEEYLGYLTSTLNLLACLYAIEKRFADAYHMIDSALSLMPLEANFYDTKGEIFLMQGNTQEALKMWEKVLEQNPNFLDKYPDGTNLSNGLKKLGIIK